MLASGSAFQEVDVLGYNLNNSSQPLAVNYSFGLVASSQLNTDQTGATQLTLQYGTQEIQQYNQKSDGSYPATPDSTASWDMVSHSSGFKINGSTITPVPTSALTSPPTPPTLPQADVYTGTNPKLNYYVRFIPFNGSLAGTPVTLNGNQFFCAEPILAG